MEPDVGGRDEARVGLGKLGVLTSTEPCLTAGTTDSVEYVRVTGFTPQRSPVKVAGATRLLPGGQPLVETSMSPILPTSRECRPGAQAHARRG